MESGGLLAGYTDLLSSQPFYKVTLTVTKATMVPGVSETTTATTWMTRSWDDDWNCTDCRPKHSIFKNSYFALVITDHHGLAKVPCVDGICIASCRFEGFTLSMMLDHVYHMLSTTAIARWSPGATTLTDLSLP